MAIREMILPEFDQEMASTRRALERIPEDKLEWRPHEKSLTLGELASHLANMPAWTAPTMKQDSLDVAPVDGPAMTNPQAKSIAELLETFDKNVTAARAAIAEATDGQFQQPWTLLQAGKELLTLPRLAVVRSFILNHNVHHRGQLTVYLRLNNVPVPAIYGSSADEAGM
jgi:uncharacterized damage-inducible protein DinB